MVQLQIMKKYILITGASVFVAMFSSAQNTRTHIEKALNDPKSSENAAKADALLIDKTSIKTDTAYDSGRKASKKEKIRSRKTKRMPGKK